VAGHCEDQELKKDITTLEQSLALIGIPYSQTATTPKAKLSRRLGPSAPATVTGIANGW
jgi:hypothetical protein